MNPVPETTLGKLIERYDVFFIDQFGVLRDDTGSYPEAADALTLLKASDKTVIILSNSGRSGHENARRFTQLGFARESFDCFLTSGDVAYRILSGSNSPVPPNARRCFTISTDGTTGLADQLGFESVVSSGDAEIVIVSGSQAERISLDAYREMLRPAAHRGAPCICTNPDIEKLSNGTLVPAAGRIAELYEDLGGCVTRIGKPFPEIYRQAMVLAREPERNRVACVGDSLHHDIRGALHAGLDSVLVRTGVHASLPDRELHREMTSARLRPTYVMPAFSVTDPRGFA